jgi:hypothetical protein
MFTRVGHLMLGATIASILPIASTAQSLHSDGLYNAVAVSDADLTAASAMALPGVLAGNQRVMIDQNAQQFFQQVDRISHEVMDNWWAQTGAALIDNNLLSPR